jgi:hypothetical protein
MKNEKRSHFRQLIGAALRVRVREVNLDWLMAYSQTLKESVFFCDDDDTRNCLISAGAAPCCVYTLPELRSLLVRHREAPLSVDELLRFHSAKRLFNGTIDNAPPVTHCRTRIRS